jgi:SnoaL-like domain
VSTLETATALPPALQELLEKEAIREVVVRYCRGWDRLDRDIVQSVYHTDAIDDHGIYSGPAKDFFDTWAASPQATNLHHNLGQSMIELDGDNAAAETYCIATTVGPTEDGGTESRLIACRFLDRFEKRDGEWRIADRRLAFDADVVVPGGMPTVFPERNQGTRDQNDYSHTLFKSAG